MLDCALEGRRSCQRSEVRDQKMQPRLFYDFGVDVQPRLRLARIEEILRRTRVIDPIPSRNTLIALCEEGKLEAELTTFGWLVKEESFKAWVRSLHQNDAAA